MKITIEIQENAPPLDGIGIDSDISLRYGVFEAYTNLGRRIAVNYAHDCVKLLGYDGSSVWNGAWSPEFGLFGQQKATVRTLILTAHEFEALRLQTALKNKGLDKSYSAVAVPVSAVLDKLSLTVLVSHLKVVADKILVWHGTTFSGQTGVVDSIAMACDGTVDVASLCLSRGSAILELSDSEIERIVKGTRSEFSPGSLSKASDILKSADFYKVNKGLTLPFPSLTAMTKGLRLSELWMWVAGTSVGKSTSVRQIAYHLAFVEKVPVGLVFLEETREETLQKLAAIHFCIPFPDIQERPDLIDRDKMKLFESLPETQNLYFISTTSSGGFGGMTVDELLTNIRYLKQRRNVSYFAVDHLSIMVSGQVSSKEGERKDIDIMMTKLAMACVLLNVTILAVCHLSNPEGRPHEEGGRVLLHHLRGSGSLKQLSWCVIAQERDNQSENSRLVLVRVLKNRNGGGVTGPCCVLEFVDPLLIERPIDAKEFARNLSKDESKRTMISSSGSSFFGGKAHFKNLEGPNEKL